MNKKNDFFNKLVIHVGFSCSNVIAVRANPPSLRLTSIYWGRQLNLVFIFANICSGISSQHH